MSHNVKEKEPLPVNCIDTHCSGLSIALVKLEAQKQFLTSGHKLLHDLRTIFDDRIVVATAFLAGKTLSQVEAMNEADIAHLRTLPLHPKLEKLSRQINDLLDAFGESYLTFAADVQTAVSELEEPDPEAVNEAIQDMLTQFRPTLRKQMNESKQHILRLDIALHEALGSRAFLLDIAEQPVAKEVPTNQKRKRIATEPEEGSSSGETSLHELRVLLEEDTKKAKLKG